MDCQEYQELLNRMQSCGQAGSPECQRAARDGFAQMFAADPEGSADAMIEIFRRLNTAIPLGALGLVIVTVIVTLAVAKK